MKYQFSVGTKVMELAELLSGFPENSRLDVEGALVLVDMSGIARNDGNLAERTIVELCESIRTSAENSGLPIDETALANLVNAIAKLVADVARDFTYTVATDDLTTQVVDAIIHSASTNAGGNSTSPQQSSDAVNEENVNEQVEEGSKRPRRR